MRAILCRKKETGIFAQTEILIRCKQATVNPPEEDKIVSLKATSKCQFYVLTLSCQDQPGIVASVANAIAQKCGNIIESSQFGEESSNVFFMRVKFAALAGYDHEDFQTDFGTIAKKYAMDWKLHDAKQKTKTIIMVSKTDHCLNDLIYRTQTGTLPIEITRIVSNHKKLEPIATHNHIPFTHLPITKENKTQQEAALHEVRAQDKAELIILARYMQVLSDKFSTEHFGHIINIHHSFLPGFKGAKPYHRAHERGVKLIGATAHYVTPELDEGPIIEQETERVTHAMAVADLIAAGRDIERRVLARAVKYHTEHRVLLNGRRTVVFS